MTESLRLCRLLQLASPVLPVGAYSYSQGLEWAVERGVVADEVGAGRWIGDVMAHGVGDLELKLLKEFMECWRSGDAERAGELNRLFLASRESAELRAETVQMGFSLTRLLQEWDGIPRGNVAALRAMAEPGFPVAWSCAAAAFDLPAAQALAAYLWSWLENQVMAAVKLVPLGQSAGQRLLAELGQRIPPLVDAALADGRGCNFAPMLAIASARHEIQYSRLFRS